MPYAGKTLMARDIASVVDIHWNDGILKGVATALAESHGSLGAYHDNERPISELNAGDVVRNVETLEPYTVVDPVSGILRYADGTTDTFPTTVEVITSRDCGLFQINIPARLIGTDAEATLRTESTDPAVYWPVARANVLRAYQLYQSPYTRNGKADIRRWQPWVAYTTGWAMFPEWWVWARPDLDHWALTGRYLQLAIRGVANHKLLNLKQPSTTCLTWARTTASRLGVEGTLDYDPKKFIWWSHVPTKPKAPPLDGAGPRPVPNDGV